MAKIIVNNENKKSTIAPEIYGHFSEHLGRCIYEGLFVGENSDIPKDRKSTRLNSSHNRESRMPSSA